MSEGGEGQHDNERELVICSLFSGGMTLAAISEIYGVSGERVRQIVRRNGIPPTVRNVDPLRILASLEASTCVAHAARLATTSTTSVRRLIAEMGMHAEVREWFAKNKRAETERRKAWRRESLIIRMRALASRLGRTPNKIDLDRYAKGASGYQLVFGSLPAAQIAAGLPPTKPGGRSARLIHA